MQTAAYAPAPSRRDDRRGGSREILYAPLHENPPSFEGSEESDYGLHAASTSCRVHERPLLHDTEKGGDYRRFAGRRARVRRRPLPCTTRTCDVTRAHLTGKTFDTPGGVVGVPSSTGDGWATSSFLSFDIPGGVVGVPSSADDVWATSSFLSFGTSGRVEGTAPSSSCTHDDAMVHEDDVTMVLRFHTLDAVWSNAAPIENDVCISREAIGVPIEYLPGTSREDVMNSSHWSIPRYARFGRVDCFLPVCDGLSLPLASLAPVPCLLEGCWPR